MDNRNYQENSPYLMPHPTNNTSLLVNNMMNSNSDILPTFNAQMRLDDNRTHRVRGTNVEMSNNAQYSKPKTPNRSSYAIQTKSSISTVENFRIRNKDFPTLPGTVNTNIASSSNASSTQLSATKSSGLEKKLLDENCREPFMHQMFVQPDMAGTSSSNMNFQNISHKTNVNNGIQISENGKVTNIPGSMLKDQFGMIGLIMTMRTESSNPTLVDLNVGQDMTRLGIDMNAPGNNYPTFGGPFKDFPLQPHETECEVPPEYIINHKIKNKLAPINLSNYGEDLLFYLFYSHCGDSTQMAVAKELYSRKWRYHIEQRKWFSQLSDINMIEVNGVILECGIYNVFDTDTWRKVPRTLYVDCSKLENYKKNIT